MSRRMTQAEEEAVYEDWLEDGGRLWVVALAYRSVGRRAKALFAMSHRDAVALCSDPRSAGRGWMAIHAPLEGWQEKGKVPAGWRIKDSGKLDGLIEELGLTKLGLDGGTSTAKHFRLASTCDLRRLEPVGTHVDTSRKPRAKTGSSRLGQAVGVRA
jgi:hypothetical protein